MIVMRMRIRLNLIIGIWTDDKKRNGMNKYLLHSVNMKANHVAFLSHFVQKRKLTLPSPTIMRRRYLSIVIYSVHEHCMGSYREAY